MDHFGLKKVRKSKGDKVLVRLKEKSDLDGVRLTGVLLYVQIVNYNCNFLFIIFYFQSIIYQDDDSSVIAQMTRPLYK